MDVVFEANRILLSANLVGFRVLVLYQWFECLLILDWSGHVILKKLTLICLLKEANSQATLICILTLNGCQNLRSLVLENRELMIMEYQIAFLNLLFDIGFTQRIGHIFLSSSGCLLYQIQCLLLNQIQIPLCLCPVNKELEAILKSMILVQQMMVLSFQFTYQWGQLQALQNLAKLRLMNQVVNILEPLLLEKSSWFQVLPCAHDFLEVTTLAKRSSIWLYFGCSPLDHYEFLHLMEVELREELLIYIVPVLLKQDQDFLLLKDSQLESIYHNLLPKSWTDVKKDVVLQALDLIEWLILILIGCYCLFDSISAKSSPLNEPLLHVSQFYSHQAQPFFVLDFDSLSYLFDG